jgi:hypothetical protein
MHVARCRGFWLWSLAGALVTFSVLAAASIGLFVLPLAALVTALIARRMQDRAELLGALVGAGAVCAVIALLQRGSGGLDARPWLVAAAVLAGLGIASFALLERRTAPRA